MDVGGWLRRLGLEQYEATFRENEISEKVLPNLTAEDLKDLGVGMVGHRRMLLDAIATLRAQASAPTPLSDTPLATDSVAKDTAERRQVTVMFSDLVGSTALSTRMDPEDLREVISAYQRCVAETVRNFGGFVARYMGDGALIYFGYPTAHEDDAERAVRFGLALIDAVATLSAPERLQVRIGAATGTVVVGDLVGSGEAQEHDIVGETPNLAARLQAIAKPNTVVIAEATRRLLGNLFELRGLGLKELKGIADPVRVLAVLRPSSVESRFEAMHPGGLTALVGREEELDLLMRRWSKAKIGEGQVVLLSGEAGIGKSRLSAALMEAIAAEPHTRLRYFCSPQRVDSALYPMMSQMERTAGLTHDDTAQTRLDKLDALLAQTSTSRQDAALLAEMLSLPNDGRYPTLELAPEQRRQKTLEALSRQVETLTRSNPVLMIFEDAHWADPTSLEMLGRMVDRIATLPALMIVTFRPEFEAPWVGQPHVTALAINRLGHRYVSSMIDRVIGNKPPLPANIRQDIIERTDGIPLFVEEMTKAVLEAGSEPGAMQTLAAAPLPAPTVPTSLHASLMARLDRLSSAKEVAQIGAAIGREFSHGLLAAVVGKPEAELGSSLDRLNRAGLLFRKGVPPHATYLFKHALVQEAAYGTLLRQPRRALHARIAETLETQFADTGERQPEVLARHCTEAGLIEKAASLWGKAGQRSLARSALVEAIEQLTRALSQIATLPSTPALRREEINLQVALITPTMHVKGYAAPETKAVVERADVLIKEAESLGELTEPQLLFSVLYGFWVANYMAFNGEVMRDHAAQFLTLAEKQGAPGPIMAGRRLMGTSLLMAGDFAGSRRHLDRAMEYYDPTVHRPVDTLFGRDIGTAVLYYRSWVHWMLGDPAAALADAGHALKDAREIGQAATLISALCLTGFTCILCGDYATANTRSDEAIPLAEEKGAALWKAWGMLVRGWVLAQTGKTVQALEIMTEGISAWRSTGATVYMPLFLSPLARCYAELGKFNDAWQHIGEAMATVKTTKESWCEAEINRIAGEIALKSREPDAEKAQEYFERALSVARAQQAKSWELRAATSMARLWRDQGKRDQARNLLAPIYDWFTMGFDTLDLKEAKALLAQLHD